MIQNILSLNFLLPFVAAKLDFSRAIRGLPGMPRRLMLVGHKLTAGTTALNLLVTVSTESDAVQRFGEGSMLVEMWRAARANAEPGLPIDCIALAPGGSAVAATCTLALTNAAGALVVLPQAGEVMVYIAGRRVAVGVTTTDTQATAATKLRNAINAIASLPVSAGTTANTNEVLLTAKTPGLVGNDIDVRNLYYFDDRMPEGVSMTVPAMAGGTTSPDVTPVIVAMSGYRATEIVLPFTDSTNVALMEAELAARWAATNMQDGQLVNCVRGTESAITTYMGARNSPHIHTVAVTKDCTSPWQTAAMVGALVESQAAIDPALPHTGLALVGYRGPSAGNHWTVDQQNNMLVMGASPLAIASDYSGSVLRMVSNYATTQSGAPDRSMAEVAWLKTMSYYRWLHVVEFSTKYAGFKLAQYITEPIPGQKIMTAELAEEVMVSLYQQLMGVGLVQNLPYYRDTLLVEVDGPNGKLRIRDEPVIVTQHYQTELTSYVVAGQV